MIDCGDGVVFETLVRGGQWAPAHVVGTHQVLLPLAFGEETITFTPAEGEPEIEVVPPRTRGTGRAPAGATVYEDCAYDVHVTGLPELEGGSVHVVGTVDAALVGRPG